MPDAAPAAIDDVEACIGGILFADVAGFTRLPGDEDVLRFVHEFLGTVADFAQRCDHKPIVRNTWGDGLFFVFRNVRDAGLFALGLSDVVRGVRWSERGLHDDLEIRIAVHAGPVYRFIDPVLGAATWSGRHVARAARMEPVTPPDTVYATREFAALTAAQRVPEFRCEPVGRVRLAKLDGLAPAYVVRRAATPHVPAAAAATGAL
jgi:adenylate cyclase